MASLTFDPPAVGTPTATLLADPVSFQAPQEQQETSATPNIFWAILKRWPWLLVGLGLGIVVGLLYHMLSTRVYESKAQLLVTKKRQEMTASSTGVMAMVEDYVTTQVIVLKTQRILELAARKLDEQGKFQSPLSEKERDRVDFMGGGRFGVVRVKEAGSNTPSNVVELSFRSTHPADSPKFLRAIIDAYQAELVTIYEKASNDTLEVLDKDITSLLNSKSKYNADGNRASSELRLVSHEEIASIRGRITAYHTKRSDLEVEKVGLEADVVLIGQVGQSRLERLVIMDRLGVKAERPVSTGSLDSRTPEDVLFALELNLQELLQTKGVDHQEVVAIKGRLESVKKTIEQRNGPGKALDELDRHRLRLLTDIDKRKGQIDQITRYITSDEEKATKMGVFQSIVEQSKISLIQAESEIEKKRREREQVLNSRSSGGYSVSELNKPNEGVRVAPIPLQSAALGFAFAVLFGVAFAFLAEVNDRSFRSPAEIRSRLGAPVLGHIPRINFKIKPTRESTSELDPALVCYLRPKSKEAEAYSGVRTQLFFSTQGRGHQVIQVTSPLPGDGKSTLAANLAISIAESGKSVVLIDCDFRKPRVHKNFKIHKPERGLASVMAGKDELSSAVQTCEVKNLSLLPCGPRPENPSELLTSPKFQEVLTQLKKNFEYVIVDTPPVLAVTDPSAVAPRVDGVILVFRMTKKAKLTSERAREQLNAVGAKVLGVVVNAFADRAKGYGGSGGYGYSYTYDYQYTDNYAAAEEEPSDLPKKG